MGRPREFTPEERDRLVAGGYRPIEIWVATSNSAAYWAEVEAECREIAAAEEAAEIDLFTQDSLRDVLRLIDEEEAAAENS